MVKQNTSAPEKLLYSLIGHEELTAEARQVGFLERTGGKIQVLPLVLAVCFSVGGRGGQSIAAMRRQFSALTGICVARSAFWSKLSKAFKALVARLLQRLLVTATASKPSYGGLLKNFSDVIAVDSTVVKVRDELAGTWKGTRQTRKAALKVHTWIRAVSGELLKYRITPEAYGDSRAFGISGKVKNVLILLDRGYSSASLWALIERSSAFVLTRLSASYRPTIVSLNRKHKGRAKSIEGKRLYDVLGSLRRQILDVNCEFRVQIRGYAGKKSAL